MNAMKRVKILQGQMRAQDAEMSTTTGVLAGPSTAGSYEAHKEVEALRDEVQLVKNWARYIQKECQDEVLGLKMQVVELKKQVTEMQAHVKASGWNAWQAQWEGSSAGHSTGRMPWTEGSTIRAAAANTHC
jgi:hypothetical protein